jgi:hypothetical protein
MNAEGKDNPMSQLDSFFDQSVTGNKHPLIKYLESIVPDKVEVEVSRPENLLGSKPVKLFVHIWRGGNQLPPSEYAWEDDLNDALTKNGFRAISVENEKLRFGLALRFGFRAAETRYGDGYFNAVLVMFIRESEFKEFSEVAEVMEDVFSNKPYMIGNGYADCRDMIDRVIRSNASNLTKCLKYDRTDAAQILAGAVAR